VHLLEEFGKKKTCYLSSIGSGVFLLFISVLDFAKSRKNFFKGIFYRNIPVLVKNKSPNFGDKIGIFKTSFVTI
jgi:hypothetical protein